jgi:hypothetical protein
MPSYRIKSGVLILVLSFFVAIEAHGESLKGTGRANYRELKKIYDKWDSGLFGSRKLYRNRLYRLLTDMIETDIETGKDYKVSIPDVFEKKYYSSDLYNQNWLQIHGPADDSSIKEFAEKGSSYIKEIERNKHLFSLSGKILKFRIIETGYGRNVHLYLDSVKIKESVK